MAPIARNLNLEWGVNAAHALYRRTGDWYHKLERFPGALFDESGYIVFDDQHHLERTPGILIGQGGKNWISVPKGIVSVPGYVRRRPESN